MKRRLATFSTNFSFFSLLTGSPIEKLPLLGGHMLDLYRLYITVKEIGGMTEVSATKC